MILFTLGLTNLRKTIEGLLYKDGVLEEDDIVIEDIELWLQKEQDARLSLNLELHASSQCSSTADINSSQEYDGTHTNLPSYHVNQIVSTTNTTRETQVVSKKRSASLAATATTTTAVAAAENPYKVLAKGQSLRGRKKTPNYSEEERIQLKETYLRILAGQVDRIDAVEALAQSMQRSAKAIEVRFYLLQQEGVGKGMTPTAAGISAAASAPIPAGASADEDKGGRADSPVLTNIATTSPALITKKDAHKKAPINRVTKAAAVSASIAPATIEPVEMSALDIDDVDTDALLSADWGLFDDLPLYLPGEVVLTSTGEQREGIYGIVRFPGFHDPPGF